MNQLRVRLKIMLVIFFLVIILGTFGLKAIEGFSLLDSFYFTIVTVATVGYGDIHPATEAGKILAIVLIVMGVGTFLGVIANATEIMLLNREMQSRLAKINMVIGVFYSDLGMKLLVDFSKADPELEKIQNQLIITDKWSDRDFADTSGILQDYHYFVDIKKVDLTRLSNLLETKTSTLLNLLENPNLLEHESFTDLLMAVFHLKEELDHRDDFSTLPDSDMQHLEGDIKRAYTHLVHQWLDHMKHLKKHYPYLFSLAVRTNPFDRNASVTV